MSEIIKTKDSEITFHFASEEDVPIIFNFIQSLAEYEKLTQFVTATESLLRSTLFGEKKIAEVIIANYKNEPVGFALFFHNYSTFVGKPGIYLEDLFVKPDLRGKGIGKLLLSFLGKLAIERDCGRIEWAVLDWNEPSINFYKNLGAKPMDEWTIFRVSGDQITALANEFE
jgi:GNAT superfamily N-acetyltransferase